MTVASRLNAGPANQSLSPLSHALPSPTRAAGHCLLGSWSECKCPGASVALSVCTFFPSFANSCTCGQVHMDLTQLPDCLHD